MGSNMGGDLYFSLWFSTIFEGFARLPSKHYRSSYFPLPQEAYNSLNVWIAS